MQQRKAKTNWADCCRLATAAKSLKGHQRRPIGNLPTDADGVRSRRSGKQERKRFRQRKILARGPRKMGSSRSGPRVQTASSARSSTSEEFFRFRAIGGAERRHTISRFYRAARPRSGLMLGFSAARIVPSAARLARQGTLPNCGPNGRGVGILGGRTVRDSVGW